MFDYHQFKREALNAVSHIGFQTHNPERVEWLSAAQRRKRLGKNFITDERWQYRLLADRSILVEISYGWFLDHPIIGLTVFHKGDSAAWDDERSKAVHSVSELVEALELLNAGREAVA
jgi:hypothetical protein